MRVFKTHQDGAPELIACRVANFDSSTGIRAPPSRRSKSLDGILKGRANSPSRQNHRAKASRRQVTVGQGTKRYVPIERQVKSKREVQNLPTWGNRKRRKPYLLRFKGGHKAFRFFLESNGLIQRTLRADPRDNRTEGENGRRWSGGSEVEAVKRAQGRSQSRIAMILPEPKDQFASASTEVTGMRILQESSFQCAVATLTGKSTEGQPHELPWFEFGCNELHNLMLDSQICTQNLPSNDMALEDQVQGSISSNSIESSTYSNSVQHGTQTCRHDLPLNDIALEDQVQGSSSSNSTEDSGIYDTREPLSDSYPAAITCQNVSLRTDLEELPSHAGKAMPATRDAGIHESPCMTVQVTKPMRLSAIRSRMRLGEIAADLDDEEDELDLNKEPLQKARRKKHRPKVRREPSTFKKRRGYTRNKKKDASQVNGLQGGEVQLVHDNNIAGEIQDGHQPFVTACTLDKQEQPLQIEPHQWSITNTCNALCNQVTNAPMFHDDAAVVNSDSSTGSTVCPQERGDEELSLIAFPLQTKIVSFPWQLAHVKAQEDRIRTDSWKLEIHLNEIDWGNQHGCDNNPVLHNFFERSAKGERLIPADLNKPIEGNELTLYNTRSYQLEAPHSHGTRCGASADSFADSNRLALMQESSTQLTLAPSSVHTKSRQMVVYNQKREIVLSKFAKRPKKPRAKVPLDPETHRVWLLLENGGQLPDEENPQRAKYWEETRAAMKRHVELFIATMHTVQGNRRFSPWKGSVVDSVVGAFLTQNVSDHLSSSAFMCVASRFPAVPTKAREDARATEADKTSWESQGDTEDQALVLQRVATASAEDKLLDKEHDLNADHCLYHLVRERLPTVPAEEHILDKEVDINNINHLVQERLPTVPAEEHILDKEVDINNTNHCPDDEESTNIKDCDFTGPSIHVHDDRRLNTQFCDDEKNSGTDIEDYHDVNSNTPDPPPLENNKRNSLVCEDERSSSTDLEDEFGNANTTMRQGWGAVGQRSMVYRHKVCRKLNFGSEAVGRSEGCQATPGFKPDEQPNSTKDGNIEVGLELVLSDQQSETETAPVLSNSPRDRHDSDLFLKSVQESSQELNVEVKMVQDTVLPLLVSNKSKKRPLSIASMSGLERAKLEASQTGRKKTRHRDWESLRKQLIGMPSCSKEDSGGEQWEMHREKDSVDWNAVRHADLGDLAATIKERGMHHVLSGRIKAFLDTLYQEHGSIDLEWIRNLSTEDAREYLMSIHGLGVKSVECIRLLTLRHLAFPVDTNVGRICVRLGWVPIEPLPEELQLHLLELYPVQETIQKYLWPRLCTLDQRTLYELHYQLITFGKVFCTKSKPNCNACPMRAECKHFASAYASAKPLLTGTKEDQTGRIGPATAVEALPAAGMDTVETALLEYLPDKFEEISFSEGAPLVTEVELDSTYPLNDFDHHFNERICEGIVEEPASPDQSPTEDIMDLEDMGEKMQYIYDDVSDYSNEFLAESLPLVQSSMPCRTLGDDQMSPLSQQIKNDYNQLSVAISPGLSASLSTTEQSCCQSQRRNLGEKTCGEFQAVATEQSCCQSQCSNLGEKTCSQPQVVATSPVSPNAYQLTVTGATPERPAYQSDIIVKQESNAMVALPPEAAQIPVPKLKNVYRLRTIHFVYELPDNHPLLEKMDAREKDDPCFYLLAIWSPGETPESQKEIDDICTDDSCASTVSSTSGQDETVSGTLLIPCRTAMRGSFPLNGTYFQVNEVFADYESSLHPLQVPRSILWNLCRRYVYFGTSVPNIFRGLSTSEITQCFWRGHVCVRGFDRETRAPKPLVCRLHFPISKQQKSKKKAREKV